MLDIILAILVMFIFISLNLIHKQDVLMQEHIKIVTKEFVNNVIVHGYITTQMYDNFMNEIKISGKYYEVDLLHEQIKYIPEYKDKVFTGDVSKYHENYYEGEILDRMYEKGIYWFGINDNFTVKIIGKSDMLGSGLLKTIIGSPYYCIAECFGKIRDIILVTEAEF